MYKYKKVISILCIVFLLLNILPLVSAVEPTNQDQQSEQIDCCRIEDAYVDVSIFTKEDLDYIDLFVREDNDGNFYITDENLLSSYLTNEKYLLVEEQISICNTNARISTYAATGTEKNPYVLEPGALTSVSASSAYWFKCSIEGATEIGTSSSPFSAITIYKKTLFGKTLIKSFTASASNETFSDYQMNSGYNTYLVCMEPSSATTISCRIRQHLDSHYIPIGALWTPNDQSAVPSTQFFTMSRWYVPKEHIGELINAIEHDDFLHYYSLIGQLGIHVIAAEIGTTTQVLAAIVGFFGSSLTDLPAALIRNIKNTADPDGDGAYEKGILMTRMFVDSGITYFVSEWREGAAMYGGNGQVGTWVNNNFE